MKKILIIEDEAVIAENIKLYVQEKYHVAGIAYNCETALDLYNEHKPQIILCDINMKEEQTGLDVANQICKDNICLVFVTAYHSDEIIDIVSKFDNVFYITKPFTKAQLIATLKLAEKRLTNPVFSADLTKREKEVLKKIQEGKTSREIAELLCISLETVRTHKRNLFTKFNANCIESLISKAISQKTDYNIF